MASKTTDKLCHSFIIKAAMETVRRQCPDKTFDEEIVRNIHHFAEATVNELSQTLNKIRKEGKTGEDAVSHLTPARVTKIKKALDMKTFHISINVREKKAQFKRHGKDVYPAITLRSLGNLNRAIDLQIASIVVEAIILVLEIIGIDVPDDKELVKKAIDIVIKELSINAKLLEDVDQIRKDRNHFPSMAIDILALVMDCMDNIFWPIVKALLSNMSWYDWILISAEIAAFIAMLVFTDGIADIALLVVKLASAAVFIEKIKNLVTFSRIKNTEF